MFFCILVLYFKLQSYVEIFSSLFVSTMNSVFFFNFRTAIWSVIISWTFLYSLLREAGSFRYLLCVNRGNMVDAFRMHIMRTKDLGTCPIRQIGGCSFLYMRISNVYIVIVVSSNANAACALKFVVEVYFCFSVQSIMHLTMWRLTTNEVLDPL